MTKKDLIKQLAPFTDDTIIVLSRDSEGNGFNVLDEVISAFCTKSYPTEVDMMMYKGEDKQPCAILYPTD